MGYVIRKLLEDGATNLTFPSFSPIIINFFLMKYCVALTNIMVLHVLAFFFSLQHHPYIHPPTHVSCSVNFVLFFFFVLIQHYYITVCRPNLLNVITLKQKEEKD